MPHVPFQFLSETNLNRDELYKDVRLNETLCERYQSHMQAYGRNVLKDHEKVMTASSDIGRFLFLITLEIQTLTSTGNVSYVTPTLHTMFAIPASKGAYLHHSSFAEAAGKDEAHEEAIAVGKSLALTGWDMLTDNEKFEAAHNQWCASVQE